jgi:dTDP-4-amino-4,6-dideoxygalactose transaminase
MTIPLVDLAWQHREIEEEVRAGWERVLGTGAFVLGPEVERFEAGFAAFCGVEHCIGVANGTDALELAIRALQIGAGDEILLPANTFIASALAVVRAGATPVLVDCDAEHHLIDVDRVADCIGARTRAVMAVDLFGQLPDMESLEKLAAESGIALIEDAAQSQGARRHGRPAGSFGEIAGTSFYPGKNLGAYGDAGALLTARADLAERIRRLRNYGSDVKYHHPELGFNSRLDSLQAVVLSAKLSRLEAWNAQRREAAQRYDALLGPEEGLAIPKVAPGNEPVWHVYAIRVADRDRVLAALQGAGIGAGIHYPSPIHLQGAFSDLGHRVGDFPEAERAAAEMISLPLFPGITAAQQEEVAERLCDAIAGRGSYRGSGRT